VSPAVARRALPALVVLTGLAAALLLARVQPAPSRTPAFSLAAGGALTLQSDRHGVAILQADAMRPGDRAEGTATLSVSDGAALSLRAEAAGEQPGAGGALLSERLVLAIDDVTDPARPASVYRGPLAPATLALGTLAGGTDRRYRFRVTLPPGVGDNALQGAALTARFVWTAVAAAPGAAPAPSVTPPQPTIPPGGGAAPVPGGQAAAAARLTGLPAARGCVKRRRYLLIATPRAGVRVSAVQVFVDNRKGRAARKPRKAKLDLKRIKRSRVTVRVVVKTSAGLVTVTRAYRLCRR
jgi:hypothetical protein